MIKQLIFIFLALALTLGCGMSEDDIDEGATGLESGDEANEEEEKEACVSFSETCPEHCYTGSGGLVNQEKNCVGVMVEEICSDTPRLPGGFNADIVRLHVPSGEALATPSRWEEFDTDEWETTSEFSNISCNEL